LCIISAKCVSNISARSLIHRAHAVCICVPVAILDPHQFLINGSRLFTIQNCIALNILVCTSLHAVQLFLWVEITESKGVYIWHIEVLCQIFFQKYWINLLKISCFYRMF
jgi:hypothetical protein